MEPRHNLTECVELRSRWPSTLVAVFCPKFNIEQNSSVIAGQKADFIKLWVISKIILISKSDVGKTFHIRVLPITVFMSTSIGIASVIIHFMFGYQMGFCIISLNNSRTSL